VRLAGTPHVSLPTDIIQLFGTSGAVAGSVYGVFELGERWLATQRLKDALSKWLLTFDVKKAGALPDGTQEIFERIFGERHFSWKCFIRSAAFSIGAMAFISILILLISPKTAFELINKFLQPPKLPPWDLFRNRHGDWLIFTLWLPWSIIIDYVSLFKTRIILRALIRIHFRKSTDGAAILCVDYIVYVLLFSLGFALLASLWVPLEAGLPIGETLEVFVGSILHVIASIPQFLISSLITITYQVGSIFILFWAGFAPSMWLWLYILALFVTRGLLRSERIVTWLRWALDIEKNPFRSIGAVAATLAFIASVAIILVSIEVSKISAA
jgi:hypothetical protein